MKTHKKLDIKTFSHQDEVLDEMIRKELMVDGVLCVLALLALIVITGFVLFTII